MLAIIPLDMDHKEKTEDRIVELNSQAEREGCYLIQSPTNERSVFALTTLVDEAPDDTHGTTRG